MERTQVSLTTAQMAALRDRAREQGRSIAALVRQAVDALLDTSQHEDHIERSLAAVGRFRSRPDNVAKNHDQFLEEAFRS